MKILFLSHTYWDSIFRVGSHHLAAQMAALGHQIFYVSTPISPLHYLKYKALKHKIRSAGHVREAAANLNTLVPVTPVPAGLLFARDADAAFCAGTLRSRRCSLQLRDTFDLVFIDDPKFAGLLPQLSWRRLIYRPTDVYSKMGLKNWQKLEGMILRQCDRIIATAEPVAKFLQSHFAAAQPAMVQVNGVDAELFSTPQPAPTEYRNNGRKRCVYVGALDFRFDFDALQQLVRSHPQVDFYIIGPCTDDQKQRYSAGLPNIIFLGSRTYKSVPAYLQHADVGLLPLSRIPANAGRSPMKIFEYLAAGLPVVALETEELARRNTPRVFRYRDDADLNMAFIQALDSPKQIYIDESVSWKSITDRVLQFALQ
jgi:glycosyltransferase involved in cell wall biosynthesis